MSEGLSEAKPGIKENSIMQFFKYDRLPRHFRTFSEQFCDLAKWVSEQLPDNEEKTMALRKILEAKDCAVRAVLYKEPE